MLSSHLFFCLPCLLLPFTVFCKMVLSRPDERKTCHPIVVELQRKIQALEMGCYRKILRISYKNHVTNEGVRAKIQQAIGPHEDLLTIVRDANCSGMVMSPVHEVWLKPSCKAQGKWEEDKADRRRGGKTTSGDRLRSGKTTSGNRRRSGKTTSGNGRAWSSPSPRGQ